MDEKSAEPACIYEGGPKAAGTLVIKLGYRGEGFCGFAEQPAQRTVAGELRRALETTLRRPCELTCAGRTDAGVHAIAQYVSVPVTAHAAWGAPHAQPRGAHSRRPFYWCSI